MNLLTPEDKKNLRLTSKYLNSVGLDYGIIDYYLDEGFNLEFESYNTVHFSNNYGVKVPQFVLPVIKKVYNYCLDNFYIDVDSPNYHKFEITIDAGTKIITGVKYWSYIQPSDGNGSSWDMEDDEEDLTEIFTSLKKMGLTEGEVVLDYNGSGDSGYIENYFRGNEYKAPATVENWCYDQLESLHGGWEINEGSEGYFTFDVTNKIIHLEHTFNEEVHKEDTLFEENFDK